MLVLMLGVLSCPVLGVFCAAPMFGVNHGFTKKLLEDITVEFVNGTPTQVDKHGESCQWVPYHLCVSNNDVNNPSITGYGNLDDRFGESDTLRYREIVEVCCTITDPSQMAPAVPKATPKPTITPKPTTTARPTTTQRPATTPKPVMPDPTKVKGCGYRNTLGLGYTITAGVSGDALYGEFPWVVALLDGAKSSYAGAGALINPRVVMTVAHIAKKCTPGTLKIRAGEWDTQTDKELYEYQERIVQNIYIHENFQPYGLKNDIALLLLEQPVVLSEHINVICLPRQDEVFDYHRNCVANAWKKDEFDQKGSFSVILKKVEMDMLAYSRCNTLLKRTRLGNKFRLDSSFVCAGGEEGKDICQGGAPLACPIGNKRYKLTGLVSWGVGCAQKDVPALYVNVPLFRNWVDHKMREWGVQ